ncbi:AAA family ATPase [Dongia sp.]|uniref:ATP-binding protein n=1 Tax=Dongia sp. TaxID=1977262 RepID=UPI0035AE3C45
MTLLERDQQLALLHQWAAEAANGAGRIVLLSGEAGIGKTSLLQHFARDAELHAERVGGRVQRTAARFLWGGCESLFTPHPLAPLYDIARQIGGSFAPAILHADRREIVFNLTIDQLMQLGGPTVLIIEDAHWADEATLDLVKFLGRRLRQMKLLLILSYRADEIGKTHLLRGVIGELPAANLRRLELEPLSEGAVTWLAAAAGRPAADLYRVTCGNPFFVTEALAVPQGSAPATVRDAVIARLQRLSPEARGIADLVAVVPGRTERWLLERTVGDQADAIAECLAAGMVIDADGAVAFRHELARRVVEAHLTVPRRQDLHACILYALQQRFGEAVPLARLVYHADQSNDSASVLRYAPVAAEQAAALNAHREAAAHYESALRHAGSLPPDQRARLYERFSYECYVVDRIEEAVASRRHALALWCEIGDKLREGDNLRWLSRLSWFNGRKDDSEEFAKQAIACLNALPPGPELAMACSNCAQLYMLSNRTALALEWGAKAIALAEMLGEMEILSHALNNVGTARLTMLDEGGRADLERSLQIALDLGYKEQAARAYTNLATTTMRIYRFDAVDDYLAQGIPFCESFDLDAWGRYMKTVRAIMNLERGQWDLAAEDAEAVVRHPLTAPISKIPALTVLGLLRARRGEAGADEYLEDARQMALPTGEMQRIGFVTLARAESAWLQGRLPDMADELAETWQLAIAQPEPWMNGALAMWRRRLDPECEDCSSSAGLFLEQMLGRSAAAAEGWAARGCIYLQAAALVDSDNEDDLRTALNLADELGAAPLAGMLRRKLRAGGARAVKRGAQARHRQNPFGLTTRELGVLAHLAEGRRNAEIAGRLFVSEKTVDHHVSAILGKLDVRSRGEAAALAARLGLVSTDAGVVAAAKMGNPPDAA